MIEITKFFHEAIEKQDVELAALYIAKGVNLTEKITSSDSEEDLVAIGVLSEHFNIEIADMIIEEINKAGFENPCDTAQIGLLMLDLVLQNEFERAQKCIHPHVNFTWCWGGNKVPMQTIFTCLWNAQQYDIIMEILTVSFNSPAMGDNNMNTYEKHYDEVLTLANQSRNIDVIKMLFNLDEMLKNQRKEALSNPDMVSDKSCSFFVSTISRQSATDAGKTPSASLETNFHSYTGYPS